MDEVEDLQAFETAGTGVFFALLHSLAMSQNLQEE